MELTSETQQVEYNKHFPVPKKVTMTYYNGWYKTNKTVEFNLMKGTTTPSSYPFYSGTDFTFLAEFTRNDSTLVKNVSIKVQNSDGTVRTLPATYDGKQNCWVATTKYSSANRLPRNVAVDYDYIPSEITDSERYESIVDQATVLTNCASLIYQYYLDCTEMSLIEDGENALLLKCKFNDTNTRFLRIEYMEYSEAQQMMKDMQFIYDESDDGITATNFVVNGDNMAVIAVDMTENVAFRITMFDTEPQVSPLPVCRAWGDGLRYLSKGAGVVLTAIGVGEYWSVKSDYNNMRHIVEGYQDNYNRMRTQTVQLILAKCSDGKYRLTSGQMSAFNNDKNDLSELESKLTGRYYKYIDEYQSRLWKSLGTDLITLGLGKKVEAIFKTSKFIWKSKLNKWFSRHQTHRTHLEISAETLSNTLGVVTEGAVESVTDVFQYKDFKGIRDYLLSWAQTENTKLTVEYNNLQARIRQAYSKCEDNNEEYEEEENDKPRDEKSNNNDFKGEGTHEIIDPSGYVYEAVLSNRLEGVKTTCYQKVSLSGAPVGTATVWNAADYSQQNPLMTDATGFYRWDVPQGMWQVKYEKEGYETCYSDWLPVPPPQLDVNIGMKQSTPPTVKQMRGYESGIIIEMAKYMRPATMTAENITVTRNGTAEKGSIECTNAEEAPLNGETYVSKVKFVPQNRFNTTDQVVVTVHKEVESYCGVKMTNDHVETVKIEPEVKDIVADSVVTVPYQGERELRVLVLPKDASAGKTLRVKTSSELIASVSATDIEIGQEGAATLTLGGELPGGAVIDFSVDGTDVTATSRVKVVIGRELVATPVASIRSDETIEGGTKLVLTCSTEGATIYYTLDGSCPCDEATRHRYDGPITIATDVIVKAIAVKEGMDDSDIATFIYIVNGIRNLKMDKDINIAYADGVLTITGAEGCTVRVFDMLGRELVSRRVGGNGDAATLGSVAYYKAGKSYDATLGSITHYIGTVRIQVPLAENYIVSVTTKDGQTVVRKVTGR